MKKTITRYGEETVRETELEMARFLRWMASIVVEPRPAITSGVEWITAHRQGRLAVSILPDVVCAAYRPDDIWSLVVRVRLLHSQDGHHLPRVASFLARVESPA